MWHAVLASLVAAWLVACGTGPAATSTIAKPSSSPPPATSSPARGKSAQTAKPAQTTNKPAKRAAPKAAPGKAVSAALPNAEPAAQKPPAAPVAAAIPVIAAAQPAPTSAEIWPDLNLDFEQLNGEYPVGWGNRTSYAWGAVTDVKKSGDRSLQLRAAGTSPFGTVIASVPAEAVRGRHLTLSGWVKTTEVRGSAALFLRVDGGGGAFDDMADRKITGTTDWTRVAVEVDVPEQGATVVFGTSLVGAGAAWFDDLKFEVSDRPKTPRIVLEGVVVDAAGNPVIGAEVALQALTRMSAHVRSDGDGRFRFEAPAGRWGFSASHRGHVGGFLNTRMFTTNSRNITLILGATDGVVVRGKVAPRKLPRGSYVEVAPSSSNDADGFAVPVAEDGTFEATLPRSDLYTAKLIDGVQGRGTGKRIGERVDITITQVTLQPPPAEVVRWIGTRGVALASTQAGSGFTDLAPLAKLIGKARVVALGEATHGAREFFQLKHRVLEYLVAVHGFSVFAIEANQPECRVLNDYVLRGVGDPRKALDGTYSWSWNTEEVLAMIEWMRAWNADPKHKKVELVGFDMQVAHVAHANVSRYLAKVSPNEATGLLWPIELLSMQNAEAEVFQLSEPERKQLRDGLAQLATAFDRNAKLWTSATSASDFGDARHDVTILEQATSMYMVNRSDPADLRSVNLRDRAMASNIQWLLANRPAGTRMVVWAHNRHIANRVTTFTNMGSQLRRALRASYVNLGFMFSHGAFQAIESRDGRGGALGEITLDPPPGYYASSAFSRTGKPLVVLDLRTLPRVGPVREWFATPHPVRQVVQMFLSEEAMTSPEVLLDSYDAVVFVDKTTRARPNPPRT